MLGKGGRTVFEQREFDPKKIRFYNKIALTLLAAAIIFNMGAIALTVYGLGLEGVVEANPFPAFLYDVGGPFVVFLVISAAWICTVKFVHRIRFTPKQASILPVVSVVFCSFDFFWNVNFLTGGI